MWGPAKRIGVLLAAIVVTASCVALDRLENRAYQGHSDVPVILPDSISQLVEQHDVIFIGRISSARDTMVTPETALTSTEPASIVELVMTAASETATASGQIPPPTIEGYAFEYPVTIYEASIEDAIYDPLQLLEAGSVVFTMGGHVADSATATALPYPYSKAVLLDKFLDAPIDQFRPQVGERSLFLLNRLADGDLFLHQPYTGRLDISGDRVRYYSNPPAEIGFTDRTLVDQLLSDLRSEVDSVPVIDPSRATSPDPTSRGLGPTDDPFAEVDGEDREVASSMRVCIGEAAVLHKLIVRRASRETLDRITGAVGGGSAYDSSELLWVVAYLAGGSTFASDERGWTMGICSFVAATGGWTGHSVFPPEEADEMLARVRALPTEKRP